MPDDQTQAQNPNSEENSIPQSPQDPTEPAFETTAQSESPETTPEPQEPQGNDFESKVTNEHLPENPELDQAPETENERKNQASDPETAQTPGNEPFENTQDKSLETENKETEPNETEIPEPAKDETRNEEQKSPGPEKPKPIPITPTPKNSFRELLVLARNAIQFRKRKKLDKVISLFLKQSKITNDEVEKLLHISDATATRYLSQLEKEGKIKQNSRTGKGVSYSRI